jgi:hypothetical protein
MNIAGENAKKRVSFENHTAWVAVGAVSVEAGGSSAYG